MQSHVQEPGIPVQVMKEKFQPADVYNSLRIRFIFSGKEFNKSPIGIKDFPVFVTDTNRNGRISVDILNVKDVFIYRLTVKWPFSTIQRTHRNLR